jgi:molecular chaperone DnaK (HSP70)
MSVVGIDFGDKSGVIAIAQRGGVDIVDNEASNRQTPMLASFCDGGQRAMGETASVNFLRNARNTVVNIKRFLGRSFADPAMAAEVARQTATIEGDTFVLAGASAPLTPEQVAAMILVNLKVSPPPLSPPFLLSHFDTRTMVPDD